ncbi:MAG: hypothetical protein ACHQ4H_08910, partial [Ktedonobacterales bacterium]
AIGHLGCGRWRCYGLAAPRTGPLAPFTTVHGATDARAADFGAPALRKSGMTFDETEARAAINWLQWLQAQGARPHDDGDAPRRAGRVTGQLTPPAQGLPPPAVGLPTGPLPQPSSEELREMFAELGAETAANRVVEGVVVARDDGAVPSTRAFDGGDGTLDDPDQFADGQNGHAAADHERDWQRDAASSVGFAPSYGNGADGHERETAYGSALPDEDGGAFAASAAADDEWSLPMEERSESPAPVTLEALERTYAGSGFQPIDLRPGELASIAGQTGSAPAPRAGAAHASQPLTDAEHRATRDEPAAPAEPREPPVPALDPADYAARLERARGQLGEDSLPDTLAEYRLILKNAPGLLQDVLDDLNEMLAEHADQPEIHRLLGDAHTRTGDYLSAIEAYNRAVALSHAQND